VPLDVESDLEFQQDIAYDTSRIRRELGYQEPVSYEEGLRRTLGTS
jgi:nucleoside-diphosphate-sugar epimerase